MCHIGDVCLRAPAVRGVGVFGGRLFDARRVRRQNVTGDGDVAVAAVDVEGARAAVHLGRALVYRSLV